MQDKTEDKIKIIQREEEEKQTQKIASNLRLPYLNLSTMPIDPSGLSLISLKDAKDAKIIIIKKFNKNLKIAVKNPESEKSKELLDKLKGQGYSFDIFVVSDSSLESAWKRYKDTKIEKKKITKEVEIIPEKINQLQTEIKNIQDIGKKLGSGDKITTTELLEIIIAGALTTKASDIHFEIEEEQLRLRLRIDGILQDVIDLPTALYNSILSRVKILSELKINIHDVPQDGRFTIVMEENKEIEIRTSIIPAAYGENIVLRILDPDTISLKLEDLGLEKYALEIIAKELKKPNGMIVNTGPTGSGKTTTLYAFLNKINNPDIKIITLEYPIEYHIEGIEQTQINPKKNYTFAVGLKSILRQDPDVILLGEIRDGETAGAAINAALTGHLVFTTLHTNDAAGAIPRLIDMKVNPSLIPPAINLVIAQRLVRRVCKDCAEEYKLDAKTLSSLKEILKTIPTDIISKYPKLDDSLTILKAGKGCDKCNMTGHKGRIAAIELFTIDKEMEKIIIKSPSIVEVHETAIKKGMVTMKQDGIFKVLNKITTLDEIERVLGA